MRRLISLALFIVVGCTDSAKHQFGYTEPAIWYKSSIFGTDAGASTTLQGTADLALDPDTQKITNLHVELNSDPSAAYAGQADRIHENFLAGRMQEYQFKIEAAKILTEAINDFAESMVTLGIGLGSPAGGALTGIGRMLQDGISAAGGRPTVEQLLEIIGTPVNVSTNGV